MIIALDAKNSLVCARNCKSLPKQSYKCPACKQAVILKSGAVRIPHFSHTSLTDCESFSEGETKEHLQGKELLYSFFSGLGIESELEVYLPELKQRPDIFLPGYGVAIEFQCSSLSGLKMMKRSEGYREAGYSVIWIAGGKFHFSRRLTFFQSLFIQEYGLLFPYFLQLDVSKKEMIFYTDFSSTFPKPYLKISLGEKQELQKLMKHLSKSKNTFPLHLQNDALISRHEKLLIERQRNTGSLFSVLYKNGESLLSCPLECYLSTPFDWMIQSCSYTWKYHFLLWIEKRGIQSIFQKEDILAWLKHSQIRKEVVFFPFPLLEEEWKERAVWYFLKLLVQRRILAAISSEGWVVLKMADRFQTEENKLRSLKQYAGPR